MPDYFVSNTSGSDTNDGLSEGQAWKSMKKVDSFTFSPGDNVLLKRGDAWDGPLTIKGSGTAEQPITVDAYDSGPLPIVYCDHSYESIWQATAYPGVYVMNNGIQCIANSIYEQVPSNSTPYTRNDHGIPWWNDWDALLAALQPGEYAPQTNSRFAMRTFDGGDPNTKDVRLFLTEGLNTQYAGKQYHTIRNIELRQGYTVINSDNLVAWIFQFVECREFLQHVMYFRSGNRDCIVEDCKTETHGNDGCYFRLSNNMIARRNHWKDILRTVMGISRSGDQCSIGDETCQNSLIEHNICEAPYNNYLDIFEADGCICRYNFCFGQAQKRPTIAASPHGNGILMHHNIFHCHDQGISAGTPNPAGAVNKMFNNVIYNGERSALRGGHGQQYYNNIIHLRSSNTNWLTDYWDDVVSRNNIFHDPTGTSKWRHTSGGVASEYATLDELRAAVPNLEQQSLEGDPLFVNPAPPADPNAADDFKLQAASPAKDTGLDLERNSVTPINYDLRDWDGVEIPQGVGPEMGAYEIEEAGPGPGPGPATDVQIELVDAVSPADTAAAFDADFSAAMGTPKVAYLLPSRMTELNTPRGNALHGSGMCSAINEGASAYRSRNGQSSVIAAGMWSEAFAGVVHSVASSVTAYERTFVRTSFADQKITFTNNGGANNSDNLLVPVMAFGGADLQAAMQTENPNINLAVGTQYPVTLGFKPDLLIMDAWWTGVKPTTSDTWRRSTRGVVVNGSPIVNAFVLHHSEHVTANDETYIENSDAYCFARHLGDTRLFSVVEINDTGYVLEKMAGATGSAYIHPYNLLAFNFGGLKVHGEWIDTPTTTGIKSYPMPFKAGAAIIFTTSAPLVGVNPSNDPLTGHTGVGLWDGVNERHHSFVVRPQASTTSTGERLADKFLQVGRRDASATLIDVEGTIIGATANSLDIDFSVASPTARKCFLVVIEEPSEGPPPIPPVQPGIGGTSRRRRLRRRRLV